jgi:hypothetical protein
VFFHEVKITDVETFIDVGRLAERRTARNNISMENQADYQQNIEFLLELLAECFRENPSGLSKLLPFLLIFCLMQNHRFSDLTSQILSGITGLNHQPPAAVRWLLFREK